jgi:polyhydroxybutyrate depolymerase
MVQIRCALNQGRVVLKFIKVVAIFMCLVAVTVGMLGWWYLHADPIEPPDLPGSWQPGSLHHGGHTRSWVSYVPASKTASPAVVLLLHGSRGNGEQMRTMSRYRFEQLAEQYGFIAVYPDGYQQHWNDCRGSANYAANLENIDDVGFLGALVQQLVREQGVDTSRVFAAGFSNGAQMAYRLGLEAPELVAAIAGVAANLPVPANLDCTPSGVGVATLVMNGTRDPVNPYEGGLVEILGDASRGEVMSADETIGYWVKLAGYAGPGRRQAWPDRVPDDGTAVVTTGWFEAGRHPVSLVTIEGGGHSIPHPQLNLPRMLGPTSHELDGAEVIWGFFSGTTLGVVPDG